MPVRQTTIQSNFTAGWISALLDGQIFLEWYRNAARLLENYIVIPHGAAKRRSGTRFVRPAKHADRRSRPIPFEFNDEQTYIIEMGDLYFRLFANRAQVVTAPDMPLEVETPYGLADLEFLQWTQDKDRLYLVNDRLAPHTINRLGATNWTITEYEMDGPWEAENTTDTTLTPSAGGPGPITVTASSTEGINDDQGFQATDVGRLLTIKNTDSDPPTTGYGPIQQVNSPTEIVVEIKDELKPPLTARTTWSLGAFSDALGWPTATTFWRGRLVFLRGDRLDLSSTRNPNDFKQGTEADDAIVRFLSADKVPNGRWLSPEERELLVGGLGIEFAIEKANTSEAVGPGNLEANRQTGHGSAARMAVQAGNANIFINRFSNELREQAFNLEPDKYVTADLSERARHLTRPKIRQHAFAESPWSILWMPREDGLLLGLTYLRRQNVVAWHAHPLGGNGRVEDLAVIAGPEGHEVWMLVHRIIGGQTVHYYEFMEDDFDEVTPLKDGFFVDSGLTFDAWNKDTAKTLTVSQAPDGTERLRAQGHAPFTVASVDTIWSMAINCETLNMRITGFIGASEVAIETLNLKACFIDGEPPYDLPAWDWLDPANKVSKVGGAGHLEGERVQILADGAVHNEQVVANAEVILDVPAGVVHVGKGYPSRLRSIRLDALLENSLGEIKRITKIIVRTFRSPGMRFGPDPGKMQDLPYRKVGDAMDFAPPLITDAQEVSMQEGKHLLDPEIWIEQSQPLPSTVLSFEPKVNVGRR